MNNYLRNTLILIGIFTIGLLFNSFFVIPLCLSLCLFSLFVYADIFKNTNAELVEQKLKIITDRLTSLERKTNTKL